MHQYTYDKKPMKEYANFNRYFAMNREKDFDDKNEINDRSLYRDDINKKCFDDKNESDLSLMKIKESYPNVKLLVDTQSTNFPQKVMKILTRSDWKDIISWTSSGKAFRIYDPERLMQVLTPYYYLKVTKFDNFKRKLYSWGFRKVQNGVDRGAWHREYFIRDKPGLCLKIARTPTSKVAKRKCRNTSNNKIFKRLKTFPRSFAYSNHDSSACCDAYVCGQKSSKMALKKMLISRMNEQIASQICSAFIEKDSSRAADRDESTMNVADILLNMRRYPPSA